VSVASIKEKAKPKGDYGFLDAGDDYPADARKLEIEAQIKVRLLVSAEGKVTKATLLNKLGHGLDELALARAKKIEFEPAIDTDDRPVASVVVWTFTFTLPGS
jgi:TonB family protein